MIVTSLKDTQNVEINCRKISIKIHISQIGAAVAYLKCAFREGREFKSRI